MLNGQGTVFLSCSEKFKDRVAVPIREALRRRGLFGVIVSDEPLPPRTPSDPDSKVEFYLNGSDAFVALCTPDNLLDDSTVECRQNIVDEIQRARGKPHLRERIQVFKEASVQLPSNLNPVHERLDPDDVSPVADLIVRQLEAWGVLDRKPNPAPAPSVSPRETVGELINGLGLGDHDEATTRAYNLLRGESRRAQKATVEQLSAFLRETSSEGGDEVHRASSILEAINRLDLTLVPLEAIEELANAEDHAKRMSAAMLLWDRAEAAPDDVPVGLLGRLALPSAEDWYVQAPAMAAAKQLLLRRRSARVVFDGLASSSNAVDRYAVAEALLDVSQVNVAAIPRDLAESLARDEDNLVSAKAREVLAAIGKRSEEERNLFSPFGL
jgi:hypothetical protein